ncbi:MAG: hypothetical protein ABSE73_25055, partial [Planctomycetota bacterium]
MATLLAMWLIPCQMAWGKYGSLYTFAYSFDEVTYADLVQPRIQGTTAANPVNRFGEPRAISQRFLEDLLRGCATALRLNAIEFFWIWRFLFPLVLFLTCFCLAQEALRPGKRLWRTGLAVGAAWAGTALMACEPWLFKGSKPPDGWAERIPTNIEFPASILMAALYLRALRAPSARNWVVLAGALALLVYIRLYAALPWALAICCGALLLLVRGELPRWVALVAGASFVLGLVPWLAVYWHNSRLPVQAEVLKRYFERLGGASGYAAHWRWWLYFLFAAAWGLAARFMGRRDRVLAVSGALVMLVTPFVVGALPVAGELLAMDRYSNFYWPLTFAAVLLVIAHASTAWRGRAGWR